MSICMTPMMMTDPTPFRTSRPPTTTPTVFVVDGDGQIRKSLELLIRAAGWQSELFASARAFLAHPRTSLPSCLVLDVELPDLNGLDLQTCVAAERPDMPIIFLTGVSDVPLSVKAMKAGTYELKWFDTVTGKMVTQTGLSISSPDVTWQKPDSFGNEIALFVKRLNGD